MTAVFHVTKEFDQRSVVMRPSKPMGLQCMCEIVATFSIIFDGVAFGQTPPKPELERQLITRLAFMNASVASGARCSGHG
jgi:hypothetical protein